MKGLWRAFSITLMLVVPFTSGAVERGLDKITITVKRGDTLQRISMRYYGTTRRWHEIFKLNSAKLNSFNSIEVGQVLEIRTRGLAAEDLREDESNKKTVAQTQTQTQVQAQAISTKPVVTPEVQKSLAESKPARSIASLGAAGQVHLGRSSGRSFPAILEEDVAPEAYPVISFMNERAVGARSMSGSKPVAFNDLDGSKREVALGSSESNPKLELKAFREFEM